ncbi:MAG: hypothetical protein WA676_15585 [Candidatus Sulfotelmatobacter sp.]
MRIFCSCLFGCTLLLLSGQGIASSQDTNFATGPQYLMQGSPMFARSISTPSMSLAGPAPELGASDASGVLIPGASDQNVLPPNPDALPKIDLFPIFYTEVFASDLKPSFALAEPFPGLLQQQPSPIMSLEPSSAQLPEPSSNRPPPSILDNGVWQMTTPQQLRERGYGVSLAEAAAEAKARIRHADHKYTNADAARLHGGI